jgi:hypothetical protein
MSNEKVKQAEYRTTESTEAIVPDAKSEAVAPEKTPAKVEEAPKTLERVDANAEVTEDEVDPWGVGQPAPKTKYIDNTNDEVVDEQPPNAKVLVYEGDTITTAIYTKLNETK